MKFRMVDRILSFEPRRAIRGVKAVSFEEYQLKSAFGGPAALPETLLLESLFQLGNWLIVLSSDFTQMGLVLRFERVEFAGPLRPGRGVAIEATVRSYRPDGIVFDGRGSADGGEVIVGAGCLATPVPLADYHAPDDLRVLFSEIHRPTAEPEA